MPEEITKPKPKPAPTPPKPDSSGIINYGENNSGTVTVIIPTKKKSNPS